MLYRVVMEGNKSLEEVENYWSLDDVLDAIEYLDLKSQIESLMCNTDNYNKQSNGPSFSIKV